jgi:hypothetical protein
MTTYQDPPLQSRRAARQNERVDAPADTLNDPNAVITPSESSSAPLLPATSAAPLSSEPLNYATTSRPPLPQYDGQNLRPRRTAEAPEHGDLPPTEGLPRQDAPSYRPKDYSPEGRRAMAPSWAPSYDGTVDFQTQNRDQALAEAAASSPAPEGPALVSDGEHTMTRRELRALREANGGSEAPADQTPVVAQPGEFEVAEANAPTIDAPEVGTPEHVDLAFDAPVFDAPVFDAPVFEPVDLVTPPPLVAPAPQPSTRLDSALAEFDALAAGRELVIPASEAPDRLPGRRAFAPQSSAPVDAGFVEQAPVGAVETRVEQAPVEQAPVEQAPVDQAPQDPPDAPSVFEALFAAPSTAQQATPEQSAPEAPVASAAGQLLTSPVMAPAPARAFEIDPLLSAPAPQGAPALVPPPPNAVSPVPPEAPASGPTSVGHWSTQSDLDEAEQVNETTISRSVGSGAVTTSALVLPSVPVHTIGGPVGGNGEILLTGSISLPHSFSSTGAHPSQLDESDLDHMLDPGDHQVANTDSTPVRAIRAVSTQTATSAIIAPSKRKGTRGFTVLIVAASVMALVVVGLLVAGLVSGTF